MGHTQTFAVPTIQYKPLEQLQVLASCQRPTTDMCICSLHIIIEHHTPSQLALAYTTLAQIFLAASVCNSDPTETKNIDPIEFYK